MHPPLVCAGTNSPSERDCRSCTGQLKGSQQYQRGWQAGTVRAPHTEAGRGGKHPPGRGKHPQKGGWKWPKSWRKNGNGVKAASNTASSQGNSKAQTDPDPNWDNSKWNCPAASASQQLHAGARRQDQLQGSVRESGVPDVYAPRRVDVPLRTASPAPEASRTSASESDHAGTNQSESPRPSAPVKQWEDSVA